MLFRSEGARLILTDGCYADYFESEVEDEADEDFDDNVFSMLFSVRERIFDILCDSSLPVETRLSEILSIAQGTQLVLSGSVPEGVSCDFSFKDELTRLVPVLEETEAIDEKWSECLEKLKAAINGGMTLSLDKDEEKYAERLFVYFVWRYFLKSVFDFNVTEKIRLALFSVTAIFAIYR